jgi:dTDP-4-dehydrorhamnose reductase
LITGGAGQLGDDLRTVLAGVGSAEVWAADSSALDVTDSAAVATAIRDFAPDVLVNAAAYTAVDAAEAKEELAFRVNASAPAILAAALARHGGTLIHVSTDYVFGGNGGRPYDVDDPTDPRSAYGRTKLAGEQAVRELLPDASYVVRTAWVYGANGDNFVKTMARLERERDTVHVVDDQRGSPTWSMDLASGLVELGGSGARPGVYHGTAAGDTTWFGFAKAIFEELGADPERVLPTTSDAYAAAAHRPAYSVLSDSAWRAAGLTPMPHWRDALRSAFAQCGGRLRAP